MDVSVERVPKHLREEGEAELAFDVNNLLQMRHLQLPLDGEAGKEWRPCLKLKLDQPHRQIVFWWITFMHAQSDFSSMVIIPQQ